jgi:hypothetical protein
VKLVCVLFVALLGWGSAGRAQLAVDDGFNPGANGGVYAMALQPVGSAHPKAPDKILQFTSGGHVLGFGSDGVTVAGGSHALRVQFVNAHRSVPVSDGPSGKGLPGDTQRAAPLSKVTYANLWDGVTLTYDAPGGAVVRSTYRIDAYASPGNIRLRYNAPVSVESDGSLRISFQTGAMNESAPQAWQERDGKRVPTRIAFSQRGKDEIGFVVGEYDRSEPLFIDPTLTWNTFLGGSADDRANAVAVDGSGNVYVVGRSSASWGSPVRAYNSGNDGAYAAKLDSSGNLIWNTFLGGSMDDEAYAVAVDGSGNVYVSGLSSASWGSPVRAYGGGIYDAFAAKLGSSGNLIWNTFLGGSGDDEASGVAVDGNGNVYVGGQSDASWGSPVRAYGGGNYDAFAAKLDSSGNLIWNTFLGGSGDDGGIAMALDGSGNAYVSGLSTASWGSPVRAYGGGQEAFAAKLGSSGNLVWNTFLGGGGDDEATGVAVDGSGNVYVSGFSTASWGSPVRAYSGGQEAFAAKLDSSGNLIWNTFLGSGNDQGWAVAVDGSGNAYVAGQSSTSWGSPVRAYGGGNYDAFAAKLDSGGNLIWNTFLGGSGADGGNAVAADGSGNVYVAGQSDASWGSPVRAFSGGRGSFVAKISDVPVVAPTALLPGNGGVTETTLGQGSLVVADSPISTTTATQPAALANFGFTQNGILTTEAGVAASAPTTAARIFVDYSTANGTDSGVAVVNPSSGMITLNVQLNNTQGSVTTCPNQTVPANGHLARFASQLCQGVISNPFLGTLTLTSSTPFVATTLMSGTNSHGEPLYNSLPVATPNSPPAVSHLYFSQFADSGGFSTEILLMNLTGTPISGTVSFTDDNGHAVTLNFGPSIGSTSTLNYSIPGNGMLKFTTTGSTSGTPVQAGAVVVTSTAGALPSAAVVFSSYNGTGGLASQAGVLNSPVTTYSRMYVEKSTSPLARDTGVAIVNPNSSAATVQLNLVSLDGLFTASNTITVPANNHMAAFIDQSALMGSAVSSIPSNFQGVLTLSSNVPIAPVTLRSTTNQRGENLYSTLPVVDLNNPPTGPLYLPQIADGGGFTTQIILINTSPSSGSVTMNFFNDIGGSEHIAFASGVAVTISPTSTTVPTGATQQFTATVTGMSNTSVTWSVNGIQGGNSTLGTVSTGGLYTAPSTVPSTNLVTVTATGLADTTKTASATVTITAASSALQISSLSETTANSFDSLTITGTGFSEGTLAISALFIPENGDPSVMIPVSASDSSSVQVMVPTFTGLTSGTFTAETVDVQVVQFSSSTTYLSNRITGLHVNALPSVPSGVAVGAMTSALLSSTLNISEAVLTAETGNTSFSNVSAALTQFNTDLAPVISAVNTMTNDPTQTVTLTTANGTTTTLDPQTLALSDQLAQALIAAIVNQGSIPTASSSSNCPTATGNTTYDSNLCSVQTYFQTLAGQVSATPASQRSKQVNRQALEITPPDRAVLTIYANLILGSLAELCEPAGGAVIYTLVGAPIVTSYISSLAVDQETPPGADVAQGVGLNFLDNALFKGVPILGTAVDEIVALKTIVTWSPPRKGILLSSGAAGFMPGQVTFLDPNTNAPTMLLKVPVQAQGGTFDSTTLVVPPPPNYTLSISSSGSGSGVASSFPSGTSFPAGTIVGLTAVPATGSTFVGWSGACSGSGTCTVTMNQNQSVTAAFNLKTSTVPPSNLTGFWSGTWSWSGMEGICTLSCGGTFSMTIIQDGTNFIMEPISAAGFQTLIPYTLCLASTGPGSGSGYGSISGTTLQLSFSLALNGSYAFNFTGTATLDGNTLNASFIRDMGGSGSFTLTKQ